ncbi:MAG: hypothetical protein QNJ12_04875 [Ilumatobacter sp.]|uniref:hypothetical protein n=1 Tax=Ilumatobacter sp. TaxID=1967498 RepID=UPI0026384730|nr:hypothetical protein [Ilumatobacter sp.]MDJ0768101.1 hypothetical protein [Ilumatobacter sp.]
MWIELDSDRILPATTVTGTLHDAPRGGAEVTIAVLTTNSFHERVHEIGTTHVHAGRFELAAPQWPLTAAGPFLRSRWWVEAVSPDGDDYTRADFDLVPDGVEIECLGNDDLDATPRRLQQTLLAVIARFGPTRRRTLLGRVRYRVDADQHRLRCTVAIDPPGGHPPEGLEVTAELVVVESAKRRRASLYDEVREEIVIQRPTTLGRGDDLRWHGVIDLSDVIAELPLSCTNRDGPLSWAVTWAVKIVVDAPGAAKRTKPMFLLAYPAGLPRDVGAQHVDAPAAAR